jgi:AcrR family transcriptional regulator
MPFDAPVTTTVRTETAIGVSFLQAVALRGSVGSANIVGNAYIDSLYWHRARDPGATERKERATIRGGGHGCGARGRPYHHGRLREELLAASLDLLAETGVDGLSLREVARRARVSKTAPYRHFADRQALLDALAADGMRRLAERMRTAVDQAGADTEDRQFALAGAYVRFALDRPAQFQLMFGRSKTGYASAPELREAAEAAFAVALDVVCHGQSHGDIVAGDPTVPAGVAWALVHGVATLAITDHLVRRNDPPGVDAWVRAAVAQLNAGLRPRGTDAGGPPPGR